MVPTEVGTGLPAAIVGTSVMVWGVIVAICWWRVARTHEATRTYATALTVCSAAHRRRAYWHLE